MKMMNQSCVVPSWDIIEENPPLLSSTTKTHSKPNHLLPTVDYEVAELTWKDGHLGMHGFGVPNFHTKPAKDALASSSSSGPPVPERCSWDKPLAAGTLESIVNQATTTNIPLSKSVVGAGAGGEQLVTSWFDSRQPPLPIPQSLPVNAMSCLVGGCTIVGSCSVTPTLMEEGKGVMVASQTQGTHDWSSRVDEQSSIVGSENQLNASQDTCEDTGGFTIYTSASLGSAKDGTKTNTVDDHDSVCHSRNQGGGGGDKEEEDKKRVTVLGKRTRCAAVHNQSERKRRDKINQRMSTLQKLVPNSSKTDKASMLDEVIEYLKQLQNKVEIMSRLNMSTMMLPLPLQQQLLQMSSPSGMPAPPPPPPQGGFYPNSSFMASSWDPTFSAVSSFLASQSQDGGHVPSVASTSSTSRL